MRKSSVILTAGVITAMLFTGCMSSGDEEVTTVTTTETAPTQMTTTVTSKRSDTSVETGDLDGDGIRENITEDMEDMKDKMDKKSETGLDMIPN